MWSEKVPFEQRPIGSESYCSVGTWGKAFTNRGDNKLNYLKARSGHCWEARRRKVEWAKQRVEVEAWGKEGEYEDGGCVREMRRAMADCVKPLAFTLNQMDGQPMIRETTWPDLHCEGWVIRNRWWVEIYNLGPFFSSVDAFWMS